MRARAATAAGIISLATTVAATGSAVINNNCNHDVYLWPVSVDESPSSATVIKANGGSWSQTYKTCSTGGMSLKLSDTNDMSSGITQFEYTLDPGTIWYDISNVNCLPFGSGLCPFLNTGMFLESGSGCPQATCEAGASTCHDAYTYPDDNWASLSCDPSADTVLNLCSSSAGSSSGSGQGLIGALTSAAGALLGGSDATSSTEAAPAPTTSSTSSTSTPPPPPETTTSSSTEAAPTPAPAPTTSTTSEHTQAKPSYQHHWSHSSSSEDMAAVAAAGATTSSSPPPATTLATVTTPPPSPNVAVVYETVTTMVSTVVVYEHKMFHKEKRGSAHPHARRHHQHE